MGCAATLHGSPEIVLSLKGHIVWLHYPWCHGLFCGGACAVGRHDGGDWDGGSDHNDNDYDATTTKPMQTMVT
jgi:hypothetical protein